MLSVECAVYRVILASNVPSYPLAARRHCGIPEEDLLRVNLSDNRKLHLPGYIIAVDHATRSVVLSVRGTFSMQDTVTDLVCDSTGERGSPHAHVAVLLVQLHGTVVPTVVPELGLAFLFRLS